MYKKTLGPQCRASWAVPLPLASKAFGCIQVQGTPYSPYIIPLFKKYECPFLYWSIYHGTFKAINRRFGEIKTLAPLIRLSKGRLWHTWWGQSAGKRGQRIFWGHPINAATVPDIQCYQHPSAMPLPRIGAYTPENLWRAVHLIFWFNVRARSL